MFTDSTARHLAKLLDGLCLFHVAFIGLGAFQLLLISLFFTFLLHSSLVAIAVALLVLTAFCFVVLRVWVQAKWSGDVQRALDDFLYATGTKGGPQALHELAVQMQQEPIRISSHRRLDFLQPLIDRIMAPYRKELQECLLKRAAQLWIDVIKARPSNKEAHSELALTWQALAAFSPSFTHKALEEFRICASLSPKDPWALQHIASCLHDLQRFDEEAATLEQLLKLKPHDGEALYQLGTLHFKQGKTAQGLDAYDNLKGIDSGKAEELIQHYT